jgi:hypothetical protein
MQPVSPAASTAPIGRCRDRSRLTVITGNRFARAEGQQVQPLSDFRSWLLLSDL